MVIKEAMACNLPVVSVDVGDVAERLAGVEPSAIVVRDPTALGEALVDVLSANNPSNGRELIRELSEENIARKVISIYQLAAGATVKRCSEGPLERSAESAHPAARMRAG